MLRRVVLLLGALMLALAILLLIAGQDSGGVIALAMWGVILVGSLLAERFRYKPELESPPGTGWIRTDEKTVDADGVLTVWFNPATGERAYVRGV